MFVYVYPLITHFAKSIFEGLITPPREVRAFYLYNEGFGPEYRRIFGRGDFKEGRVINGVCWFEMNYCLVLQFIMQ